MDLDWLWPTARWAFFAGGVAAILFAFFWRRSGAGKRCPKCRYDMEGTPPTVRDSRELWICPECGKVAATVAELTKARGRWRIILLAIVLLAASHTTYLWRHVKSRGWPAAIPDVVLVYVVDPDQLYGRYAIPEYSDLEYDLQAELDSRIPWEREIIRKPNPKIYHSFDGPGDGAATAALSRFAVRLWVQRVEGFLARPHHAIPKAVVRAYPLAEFVRSARAFDPRAKTPMTRFEVVDSALALLRNSVYPNEWYENGGALIHCVIVRDWLVVKTDEQAQAKIATFFRQLSDQASATQPCTDSPPRGYARTPPWLLLE